MLKLRRRVRINAKGRELYKFINAVHVTGITSLGQYVRKDVYYSEIYRRDLKKVRAAAEEYEVELKEAEYVTIMSVLSRYRKRAGILVGITAALLGCMWFSQTVVTVEIQGNSKVSDKDILSVLSQMDVKRGTRMGSIDMHYCEHELQIRLKGIAWASIRRTGNRLVVQVTEVAEKPEMLLERVPCNIVAAKDAEITEVNVLDGMLMHKVGDYVPEGTLLISGVAEDDTGHITIHHAYGTITGIYTEEAVFEAKFRQQREINTGRTAKKRYLRLFSADIPLNFGRNRFDSADTETREDQLEIFGKELPLSIVTDTIRETVFSETEYTEEELDDQLMEKLYLYEKNFLSRCRIIKRDIKREKTEDSMIFRALYKIEGEIGIAKDIYIK